MTASVETEETSPAAEASLPKYQVLAEQLRRQISQGNLVSGDRLPTFAEIGSRHRVTLTTVKRVYDLLEKEGLIERQRGRGTFVAERKRVLTGNIGLMGVNVRRYHQSPFFSDILSGIEEYTLQSGQHIIFSGECSYPNEELSQKMDGFLFYGAELSNHTLNPLAASLPRVSMLNKEERVSNVIADDYEGAKMAVRHLKSFGHKRIACLMEKRLLIPCLRYGGYRDAMNEDGGEAKAEWARLTDIVNTGPAPLTYLEWGRNHMQEWLREGWLELGCTAIVVQNDVAAIGVLQTLHEAEIRVPQQVSVIGFDGTEICEHAIPRLVSMKVPLFEIGYNAARMLHEQIESGEQEIRTTMLPMSLREGGTVEKVG